MMDKLMEILHKVLRPLTNIPYWPYLCMTVFLVIVFILSGCTSGPPRPYLELGLGYQIDGNSDWYLRTERDWTCNTGETAHIELGVEFDHDLTLGYHHQSHLSCGTWNSRPELYQDEIILTKKWGGRRAAELK